MDQNTSGSDNNRQIGCFTSLHQNKGALITMTRQARLLMKADFVGLYTYNQHNGKYVLVNKTDDVVQTEIDLYATVVKRVCKDFQIYDGKVLLDSSVDKEAFLLPVLANETINGYLFFVFSKPYPFSEVTFKQLTTIAKDMAAIYNRLDLERPSLDKMNKYELIYQVTRTFHSTMKTNDILSAIVDTIQAIYPTFKCTLFLSKNYHEDNHLPIKELIYNDTYADKASVQAFLTGEIKIENKKEKHKTTLYAPLNGKQGAYGVLQLTAYSLAYFPEEDIDFINLLAQTAGTALENAELYQQSNQLIQDLQLINNFAHKLNSNMRLSETINFIREQLEQSFKAEEIGFVLLENDSNYQLQQQSTSFFHTEQAEGLVEELLSQVTKEKNDIFIGDYTKMSQETSLHFSSVMVMPMIQSEQLIGVIIILHPEPYFFSFENFKLIKSIVQHSTLAFVNILLREQLEKSVITDYLTKLYSRKYLDEQCRNHLKRDSQGTFILIDLDDFKMINDTFGHDVGDALLIQVANIIRKVINNGFAARWGGEEIAVYLPNTSKKEGKKFATELGLTIERKTNPNVTASIGVAHWDNSETTVLESLFDRADRALYQAKRSGKNCCVQIS